MSRKATCADNAVMENFFGILKQEIYYGEELLSYHDLKQKIGKYIDYYNISYRYVSKVVERVKERFPPEDVAKMEEMLRVISDELMPELPLQAQTDVAEAEK